MAGHRGSNATVVGVRGNDISYCSNNPVGNRKSSKKASERTAKAGGIGTPKGTISLNKIAGHIKTTKHLVPVNIVQP